jgi:hypothetical protein
MAMIIAIGSMPGSFGHSVSAQKADPPKPVSAKAPDQQQVNRIIAQFTAGETELLKEFGRYSYRRDFLIQSLRGGKVIGVYHRISQMTGAPDGREKEKVISLPMPTGNIVLTPEDIENVGGPYQFLLQAADANLYKFAYVGKEQISDWDLYVFDVKPVSVSSAYRVFRGRVWVDVGSLKIVKMLGKLEQKGNQKFPVLEASRATINGFLFPATVYGDDELVFANGPSLHLRITLTFTDFVKLR